MKHLILYTILLTAIICLPAFATIINIPDDYETIQQGIDASTDGDTVLVQPGTYVENVNFNGHNIVLGSLFLTTGDTTYISQTVIDGHDAGSVVTFVNGEDSTATISGFTIQNGYAEYGGGIHCISSNPEIRSNVIVSNSATDVGGGIYGEISSLMVEGNLIVGNIGGGIYCGNSSYVTIINNVIMQNSIVSYGGAIWFWSSSGIIKENNITGNTALAGGGIYCIQEPSPTIINNTISHNFAGGGGGIYCSHSAPMIKNNVIRHNEARGHGGGIDCYRSDPSICGNIILFNVVDTTYEQSSGGGIYCLMSNPFIFNNTTANNTALLGGGLYSNSSSPSVTNAIFWGNGEEIRINNSGSLTVTYSNIQGGWEGEGNIDIDPLFRDPEDGDFHLMSTACGDPNDSPCIDAGHPDIIDSLLDCSWGLGTILSDMGAYGGGDSVTVGIDFPDIRQPEEFSISQNYPNPFNAMTVIRYSLPEPSDVAIEIYDILGRKVEMLVNEKQPAGYHQVAWDATVRSSGIYFYRIQAGDNSETTKMLLIK